MKLVLIIPPSPWLISDRDLISLGPLYVAAGVKKHGFDVQVCDLTSLPEDYWRIPIGDVYGVTGVSPNFPEMKKIISILKDREPHKFVVVGGVHATVLPNHIINKTKADIVVSGEGERVMVKLMFIIRDHMMCYPDSTVDDILHSLRQEDHYGFFCDDLAHGIDAHEDKPPIIRSKKLIENLDDIDFPDIDSVDYFDYMKPGIHKYLMDSEKRQREATVMSSRGCPYNCNFCASYAIHRGKVRFRSAENVIKEVKMLQDEYGATIIYFVDDTFTLKRSRVLEICEKIAPLNLKWYCLTRVDKVDDELCNVMAKSGCVSVTFGFESGSNKVLKAIGKNTTVEQAYKAIKIVKKAGLMIRGQIMTGLPFETHEDVEKTANFMKTVVEVDKWGIHVFQPFPGCDIWNNPEKYNWNVNKDNNDFSTFHTIGKPDEKLTTNEEIKARYHYLRRVAFQRNIHE